MCTNTRKSRMKHTWNYYTQLFGKFFLILILGFKDQTREIVWIISSFKVQNWSQEVILYLSQKPPWSVKVLRFAFSGPSAVVFLPQKADVGTRLFPLNCVPFSGKEVQTRWLEMCNRTVVYVSRQSLRRIEGSGRNWALSRILKTYGSRVQRC